jgi:parallel beta-helix repeat protein
MPANVPTHDEHAALATQVQALEAVVADLTVRVAALEEIPEPAGPVLYTDSGPIVAAPGQVITRLRITNPDGPGIIAADGVIIDDCVIGPCHGHGVLVDGARDVEILDCQIITGRSKPGLDQSHGVYLRNGAHNVLIEHCHFEQNESHIVGQDVSRITIRGNYGKNPLGPAPRGQHVQMYPCNAGGPLDDGVMISDNVFVVDPELESSDPRDGVGVEDGINIGGGSKYARVLRNYLRGGSCGSGCGIILEGGSDSGTIADNILIRTSQCGISITESSFCVVEQNKILDTHLTALGWAAGNTGLVAWYRSGQDPATCRDNVFRDNIVSNRWVDGRYSDVWIKSGCGSQTGTIKGDAARALLTPEPAQP